MMTTDLLNRDLNTLIRIYDEDSVFDATALASRILSPVKSELDKATQAFSKSLFIATALHVVFSEQEPTLQRVLDCVVDPLWQTEQKMIEGISRYRNNKMRSQSILVWFKDFDQKYSSLSAGSAQRIVMKCYGQWCQAFNLPIQNSNIKAIDATNENALLSKAEDQSLNCIRISTQYELSDAAKLATKILISVKNGTDATLYAYTHELFIVVALVTAHTVRSANSGNMLEFLLDPSWDNHRQIYIYAGQCEELAQVKTKAWVAEWVNRMLAMPHSTSQSLSKRSLELMQEACHAISPLSIKKTDQPNQLDIPPNSIQVFNVVEVAKSMAMMCDLKDEKKGAGERLLKDAQVNNGYRQVPDTQKAVKILEKAKSQFENLIEPINQLQNNLVLSSAMKPENFRITPILLLGDPGIGKTYLAMALANGLGGSTEKMSAGGAQGGFQLTGSHSSWNSARCGQVFKVLAEGQTTSPVFVIDEVDKIGSDNRYPILPVLLDLFEPDTARCFKDEFFEMNFDASRIIFILTANSLDNVPEALRSRVEIYDVPRPEPEQRLRIIQEQAKQLRAATSKKIRLDKATSRQLADLTEIDLRKTTRIVKEAFTKAIIEKSSVAKLIMPDGRFPTNNGTKAPYQRSEIGFL